MVWCPGESGDQPVSCVEIDPKVVLLREKILPARWWGVGNGKRFSLLVRNGLFSLNLRVPGEFCPGWALRWVLPGEFCPACGLVPRASALYGACWPNFVARGCHMGCCCEGFVWVLGGVAAGENSPCSVVGRWEREKILPAREKWPVFVESEGAGRVLYRLGLEVGVAGRVLSRLGLEVGVAGRVLSRMRTRAQGERVVRRALAELYRALASSGEAAPLALMRGRPRAATAPAAPAISR